MHKLNNRNDTKSEQEIINILKLLKGPFSIIYYNKATNDLFFTRDKIGRNSLLFHINNKSFVISSVLSRKYYECVEVPATHIHVLNLRSNIISLHPWDCEALSSEKHDLEDWFNILQSRQMLSDEQFVLEYHSTQNLFNEDNVVEYIQTIADTIKCKLTLMKKIMEQSVINETIFKITKLLEKSVEIRLKRQPAKCKLCITLNALICHHSSVGILFSGGLDCTILAFIADKYISQEQSIDLINVAFSKNNNQSYDVPDRITAKHSLEQLKKLCPKREWVFREVNVTKEELERCQASTIADLVYPRKTILDESLGSALWFAARGQDNDSISTSRVLLLGSGADELFGGYTRHRNAFRRRGWSGLAEELDLDWKRISFRNLARDNRVICDHGRQPRMPYLDEDFTEFVLKLKPWLKCFPSDSLGPGVGDKLMLRLIAVNLGLADVALFPKRALQFGSRIANKNEKGSDLSKSFLCENNKK
ncbi:asparagine synthetase domain-containing protein CG17486 isoform X2 [Manduca sexta]|nr:asparagine synthetase domain-containing protein CG17486 isoform X2 [Manduca sexta]